MIETIKKEWYAQVTIVLFLLLTVWWIYLNYFIKATDSQYQLFAASYGIVALWGGICGMYISRSWGFLKSILGKAIFVLALGLFAQEFGQLAYSYYIYYKHIEVPYPSWGDLGYFGSIPLYIYGVWLLGKASGLKIGLRSYSSKFQAIIIPAVMLGFSYYLFLQHYQFDWSNPLTIFLDFGYPMGQAIYISIAILSYLLSRKLLGGVMKSNILFLLFALLIQYIADYTFLYQAHQGQWSAGGLNDYIYLVAYTMMAIGLMQFSTIANKLK